MKEKDPIYVVKGQTKSALVHLEHCEIRTISNQQLDQLDANTSLAADLSPYYAPSMGIRQKELLDIRLTTATPPATLSPYLEVPAVYQNVRIFCPEPTPIGIEPLWTLIRWINKNIFHFGVMVFIPATYDQAYFQEQCAPFRVISTQAEQPQTTTHVPKFQGSPTAIHISKHHNLYHYSRDTLAIEEGQIQFINHDPFDVPKHQIENCKDCAFRLTCIDTRVPHQIDERYYYTSICPHELDQ